MWPRRDLLDLLGIEHPIIQAPMAGASTPALAAAVSNGGGLGSLGCASMSLDDLEASTEQLRNATNRAFNLNFFAHQTPDLAPETVTATRSLLQPYYDLHDLGDVPQTSLAPFEPFDEARLALLLKLRPAVVSFHFGLPAPETLDALKDTGARILCSACTVNDAQTLDAAGVDAIIAQGYEAGGHHGDFAMPADPVGVGTMALVPQIVDAVKVPVIAAGGIADGRGIAAAFALGASGVQIGTAFLSCPESSVSEMHRSALGHANDDETRLTRAFSGRWARAKTNPYIEAMEPHSQALPEFPLMYGFSNPLRTWSTNEGNEDYQFMLYGQAAALNRELPAAELVELLIEEAQVIVGK